ncbi:MAG: EamA family transporter [Saprospiraceae bacterium]|nr:EamA family transporter [Saprospiraceae bacterium]
MKRISTEVWYIVLSFLTIYIVWGATYLFVSFAVKQLEPFFLSGIRFFLAVFILVGVGLIFRRLRTPTRTQIINALGVGIFFLGFGASGVAWALKTVDTGFAALLISAEPLVVVLMLWVVNRKPPSGLSFLGIAMGMTGIYLLVSQKSIVVSSEHWMGILAIIGSMLCWGAGSIYINRSDMPKSQYLNSSLQMISGGIIALLISLLFEGRPISPLSWHPKTIMSVAFLVVFGSALAFSAFNYLLTKVSPEKVATGTYVNPLVALFLGWLFNEEIITMQSLIAAGVMLTGVYFINIAKSKTVTAH